MKNRPIFGRFAVSGVSLQFGVDFGLGEVVGVVAQSCQGYAHYDFDCLLPVVARIEKCFEFVVGYCAFFRHYGLGEGGKRAEFGIVKFTCRQSAGGIEGLLGQEFFQGCEFGVPCHAEAALVGACGNDPDDFDFAGGQAVGGVELADFLVKRQGFGGVCQYADEVGDKAVVFGYGLYARFGGFGGRFRGCVRLNVPFSFLVRKYWGRAHGTHFGTE